MATIRETIKKVLAPLERIVDSEKSLTEFGKTLENRLIELRQEAAKAALPATLGGNDAVYKKVMGQIAEAEEAIIKNTAALHETRRMKSEAEAERIAQLHETDNVQAERFASERAEIGQRLADHIAGAVTAWQDFIAKDQDIIAWRGELAIDHGGLLLARSELTEMVRMEMARLSMPDSLDAKAPMRFPGTDWKDSEGSPRTNAPLVAVVKAANDFLIAKINKSHVVAKIEPAKSTLPPPATPEEMEAIITPTGPRVDAQTVMATIGGHRTLA